MLLDVDQLADIVTEAIKVATMPLLSRIAVLESREVVKVIDGKDGKDAPELDIEAVARKAAGLVPTPKDGRDGTDADPDVIRAEVAKAVAALPPPVNGRDGNDADPTVIQAEVVKAVEAIPRPRDGEHGKDGTSIDPAAVSAMVVELVSKAVEAMPKAVDGQHGKDGIGLASALIDRDGHLVLTLSDGSTKALGRVIGMDVDMAAVAKQINDEVTKWPRPKDGSDGLGFEDLDAVYDEVGRMSLTFTRGDVVKRFRVPGIVDRGVYKEEAAPYLKGDGATWGSSFWIAQKETSAKPGTNADWRLAVKRGGDGKDGKSVPGPPGVNGKDGRDLTQMDSTGRKW